MRDFCSSIGGPFELQLQSSGLFYIVFGYNYSSFALVSLSSRQIVIQMCAVSDALAVLLKWGLLFCATNILLSYRMNAVYCLKRDNL